MRKDQCNADDIVMSLREVVEGEGLAKRADGVEGVDENFDFQVQAANFGDKQCGVNTHK